LCINHVNELGLQKEFIYYVCCVCAINITIACLGNTPFTFVSFHVDLSPLILEVFGGNLCGYYVFSSCKGIELCVHHGIGPFCCLLLYKLEQQFQIACFLQSWSLSLPSFSSEQKRPSHGLVKQKLWVARKCWRCEVFGQVHIQFEHVKVSKQSSKTLFWFHKILHAFYAHNQFVFMLDP